MKLDKMIKQTFDNKTSNLDISEEKCANILNYIEKKANIKKNKPIWKIKNSFIGFLLKIHFKDFIEVVVVIAILFVIPVAIQKNKKPMITPTPINEPSVIEETKNIDGEIYGSGITKNYTVDSAVKAGNIVIVSTIDNDEKVSKEQGYNIKILDQFIENSNTNKKDKIRIIKYTKQGDKLWINKLEDVEYDGQGLTHIGYNTYPTEKDQVQEKPAPVTFHKIAKTTLGNLIRYALYESIDTKENMGMTLLSFNFNTKFEDTATIKHEPWIFNEKEDVKVQKVKYEDINGDGKLDRIEYTALMKSGKITLKINDSEIKLETNHPSSDFNIVDIDRSDNYKEIDIFQDGPSDDPSSKFFIYNGNSIIEIGEIFANDYSLDGQSKITTYLDKISKFYPNINVGWTEMDIDHKFNYKTINKNLFINKQYKIDFPIPNENQSWNIHESSDSDSYNSKPLAIVNKGETVTIIDVMRQGERDVEFKVRLQNGTEGWMLHLFGGD
jgi:hypothetical protein